MPAKKLDITGIPVDNITMTQAVNIVEGFLENGRVNAIYTPNSEIMMAAQRDSRLRQILCDADMLVADGAGVVLASKILGRKLVEKVSGVDLAKNLFALKRKAPIKYFLYGGQPGVAEEAAMKIKENYPWVEIAGVSHGFLKPEEQPRLIEEINASGADILLVALGAPRQEKWIDEHKTELKVKVCIGIGGGLDIFSGKAKLAPEFIRKNGLEWLYRLCHEPRRYKRMLDLPRYMMLVLAVRLRLKRV